MIIMIIPILSITIGNASSLLKLEAISSLTCTFSSNQNIGMYILGTFLKVLSKRVSHLINSNYKLNRCEDIHS